MNETENLSQKYACFGTQCICLDVDEENEFGALAQEIPNEGAK